MLRTVQFRSVNNDSLIQKIRVHGYRNGSVLIFLEFSEASAEVGAKYLKKINLGHSTYNLWVFGENELVELVAMLNYYNELPRDWIEFLKAIARTEGWREVTPLSKEQEEVVANFSWIAHLD